MLATKKQSIYGYFVTLLLSMCFKIVPLPEHLSFLNPDWVLLTLIYWTLVIPERIGVFNAWSVGIIVDILTGRMLGQQALVYALVSFTSLKFHRRLRQYPLPQQCLFVFICLFFAQTLTFWVENITSMTNFTVVFWMPVLVGTLFWPLIYLALRIIPVFGYDR